MYIYVYNLIIIIVQTNYCVFCIIFSLALTKNNIFYVILISSSNYYKSVYYKVYEVYCIHHILYKPNCIQLTSTHFYSYLRLVIYNSGKKLLCKTDKNKEKT